MKKILIALLIALLASACCWNTYAEETRLCTNCGTPVTGGFCSECGQAGAYSMPAPAGDEVYLSVKIGYEKNKLLAKYDVDVCLDGVSLGTIRQAESLQRLLVVKKGIHKLTLHKDGEEAASILIDAQDKAQLACTLKAHLLRLEVKELVNSHPVSAAEEEAFEMAEFAGECSAVSREELCRYPEKHAGEKLQLQGRVLATAENILGKMKILLKDGKNELWMVEYRRSKEEPRILVGDQVVIYGAYKGVADYSADGENFPNLPAVTLEYLLLK